MTAPTPARITTVHHGDHLAIRTSWSDSLFCGESWCSGDCGLPALVLPATHERSERKAHSNMVAHGPVVQMWRVPWTGARVTVPEEFREWIEGQWWT